MREHPYHTEWKTINTNAALREKLIDLIAEHLSGTYHCTRVWEAWNVGTMSQDDFEDVGESDTPAELADAILAEISTAAQPPADGALNTIAALRAQLAEAQRRIKELETPTMFWDFNNPEYGAFDSPYYAICDGDFDEGAEVSFMTARALPTKTVRVTRDSEGSYDYEYIDATKREKNGA